MSMSGRTPETTPDPELRAAARLNFTRRWEALVERKGGTEAWALAPVEVLAPPEVLP